MRKKNFVKYLSIGSIAIAIGVVAAVQVQVFRFEDMLAVRVLNANCLIEPDGGSNCYFAPVPEAGVRVKYLTVEDFASLMYKTFRNHEVQGLPAAIDKPDGGTCLVGDGEAICVRENPFRSIVMEARTAAGVTW